ncbi:hypothetical protein Pst134EA_029464 [Puccinia striiformis f. sp. tritici]|uniref:hypothetical protein n=1 Tax=Puccinia striiformis f. sp. tritici TaxID=168172 RepID=UPI002007C2A3|nr:hypothetical protein Pst134EA_029464 [Puccinia striiformis f. sp. tritici]KAH9447425.1 hypothetical protein Pst134EA_029464 [Puccinia striiformis f. sp. tritici]
MARSFPRSLQLTGLCSPKDATYTVCILLGNLPDCVTIPQDVERDDDNDGPRLFLHYNETDFTSLTVSALMERLHPELQPIIPAAYQALTTRYSLPMEVAEADDPTNIKVVFYLMCVHPHAFVQKVLHEPNSTRLLVMDFRNTGKSMRIGVVKPCTTLHLAPNIAKTRRTGVARPITIGKKIELFR